MNSAKTQKDDLLDQVGNLSSGNREKYKNHNIMKIWEPTRTKKYVSKHQHAVKSKNINQIK